MYSNFCESLYTDNYSDLHRKILIISVQIIGSELKIWASCCDCLKVKVIITILLCPKLRLRCIFIFPILEYNSWINEHRNMKFG